MKNKPLLLGLLAFVVLLSGLYMYARAERGQTPEAQQQATTALAGKEVTVYKTATCGCCGAFVSYLKNNNVAVKAENVNNLDDIKRQYGVPAELGSCHTSVVDGYVVEGHVPLEAIAKLLDERPSIKGIALPAMPSGTPGMPGPKTETWTIYSFTDDGTVGEFTSI